MEIANNLLVFSNFLHAFVLVAIVVWLVMSANRNEDDDAWFCLFMLIFNIWTLTIINVLANAAGVFG